MNITRKDFIESFIGGFAVTAIFPSIGFQSESNDEFEDLLVDRYYTYQGGEYKDTGGWGSPYPAMMNELMSFFKYHDNCRDLEDIAEKMEKRGYYLSQSQYFGKPYRRYNKIPLTKKWVMEFYRRHKDETIDDWQRQYDIHYANLRDSGWKVEDDYI